jgi:uncharacterized protein YcbX
VFVAALWRYPVKSLQGERVERATLTVDGLEGDRRWALRRRGATAWLTARQEPRLLFAAARWVPPDDVAVTLPDGTVVLGADIAPAVSAWLGLDVVLDVAPPREAFVDVAPVHVLTASSVVATSAPDVRRFRPTILVDAGPVAFAEDAWVGARVRMGSAVVAVDEPTERCVIPTLSQPLLPGAPNLLRVLRRERGALLGVYAHVAEAGEIAVRNPVAVLHDVA